MALGRFSGDTVRDAVTDTGCDALSGALQSKFPSNALLLLQYPSVVLGAAFKRVAGDMTDEPRDKLLHKFIEHLSNEEQKQADQSWIREREDDTTLEALSVHAAATQTESAVDDSREKKEISFLIQAFAQKEPSQREQSQRELSHREPPTALAQAKRLPKALEELPKEFIEQETREKKRREEKEKIDRFELKRDMEVEEGRINEELEEMQESELCKVCASREINTILLPCAHFAICNICVLNLHQCPLCREPIKATVKAYRNG